MQLLVVGDFSAALLDVTMSLPEIVRLLSGSGVLESDIEKKESLTAIISPF